MKFSTCVFLALLLLPAAVSADVPEYTAKKTGSSMAMDGILDEPAWQKAESVSAFVFPWYKEGEKEQTEAKILWDDTRIYFAFKCDDKHVWADHYTHHTAVYQDDTCEAFIRPGDPNGPDVLDYMNYEINCLGSYLSEFHCKSRDLNKRWFEVSGIEIGRVITGTVNDDSDTDTGWVLEFSIPFWHFKDFGQSYPPKDGQLIYIGLNRLGGKTNQQYSQWAPSNTRRPQFHSPADFGKVTFSTEVLK